MDNNYEETTIQDWEERNEEQEARPKDAFGRNGDRTRRERRDHPHLRNILNIIFMIGAIIGIVLYFLVGTTIGTIVILTAMAFKIVECSFRLIQ